MSLINNFIIINSEHLLINEGVCVNVFIFYSDE